MRPLLSARRDGVTLVEMLIATALMAMVAGVIVGILSGGIRLWDRLSGSGLHEREALIVFEAIRRDVHSHRQFSLIPFDGGPRALMFPAVERVETELGPVEEIGRMNYFLDTRAGRLCRSFTPYRRMRRMRPTDQCQPMLERVQQVRFEYFGAETETQKARWTRRWDSEGVPVAMKASVTVQDLRGQTHTHMFAVYLPRTLNDDSS